jgi:large subunit ribosomal protein L10
MNGLDDMKPYLNGMTALAIAGEDPIAPAKILKSYADKIESFKIVAGYLDGKVVDEQTVLALAEIPSKEVLIAKLLGSIRSPLYGLAYALQAIVDKNGEAAPAEEAPAEAAPAEA